VDARGGLSLRREGVAAGGYDVRASGAAVSHAALGASYFLERAPVGLTGRLDLDRFALRGSGPAGEPVEEISTEVEAFVGLGARALAAGGRVALEGALGWSYARAPFVEARAEAPPGGAGAPMPARLAPRAVTSHGPAAGVLVAAALAPMLGLEVAGRLAPLSLGAEREASAVSGLRYTAGAAATVGRWRGGGVRLAGLLAYEVGGSTGTAPGFELDQMRHRVGIGLRAAFAPPRSAGAGAAGPRAPVAPPPGATGDVAPAPPAARPRVRGVVRQAAEAGAAEAGLGLAGVTVTPRGLPAVRTDARGGFVIEGAEGGPLELRLELEGFLPGEEVVSVPPSGDVDVELVLRRNLAPATLVGLVRSDTGAPVAATVTIVELARPVQADARGRFSAQLPPGRYTVTIEAPGFVSQRKTVTVGAGEQSIHNVDLQQVR
jgi:hypothetical protein